MLQKKEKEKNMTKITFECQKCDEDVEVTEIAMWFRNDKEFEMQLTLACRHLHRRLRFVLD